MVPFARTTKTGELTTPGVARVWLPPATQTIRGLLLMGEIGIEEELFVDMEVRRALADNDLAMVYFDPHFAGVFQYWEGPTRDAERLTEFLDTLATKTGHPELRRVPWITAGHSTAGIFARNVAYWKAERVAAVLHIKSGNLFQKSRMPPSGSLVGVPFLMVNGQFETFGPESGIDPAWGRQTQWRAVRADVLKFRAMNGEHLMGTLVDPGADHFQGSPALSAQMALFIRKTAQYRIPRTLPPGNDPVPVIPLMAQAGWLADPDIEKPTHAAAPYAMYTGDKGAALWYYDGEMARSVATFQAHLSMHQALPGPAVTWLDEGDGWTFEAKAVFLSTMPGDLGAPVAGKTVGHASTPVVYHPKVLDPVEVVSPGRFRLVRPVSSFQMAAFNEGDAMYRSTIRWATIQVPKAAGTAQQIEFPAIADLKADAAPVPLTAKASSSLPVVYQVEYGPISVVDGKLAVADLPAGVPYPIEAKVTAHQNGRRVAPAVAAAQSVSRTFNIVAGSGR